MRGNNRVIIFITLHFFHMEIKVHLAVLALKKPSAAESGMDHEQGYTESVPSLFYHYCISDLTPAPREFHACRGPTSRTDRRLI